MTLTDSYIGLQLINILKSFKYLHKTNLKAFTICIKSFLMAIDKVLTLAWVVDSEVLIPVDVKDYIGCC